MTVEEEVRMYQANIKDLCRRTGVLSFLVFEQSNAFGGTEPLFVADLDTTRFEGYADRFFDLLFGLQEIFARPVDLWERRMFKQEIDQTLLKPIVPELQHAA